LSFKKKKVKIFNKLNFWKKKKKKKYFISII